MSRWFRHYAGMMRDDKLVRVAIRSKQTIERVVWIWGAILESAAEIDDGGRYDISADEIAYFLRADCADVDAVMAGLQQLGRIDGSAVVKWDARQFTSDRSADRQARYRERKKAAPIRGGDNPEEMSDAKVTSPSRHRDAPETETELDTEEEKPKPNGLVKKPEKGFRLPADWQPQPLTGKAAAMVATWQPGAIERELAKFKNYWLSKGANAARTDWQRTWVNWLIAADERKPRQSNDRSQQASLSSVVHRILSDGGTDRRASEDAGPRSANIDERGATRALAARRS